MYLRNDVLHKTCGKKCISYARNFTSSATIRDMKCTLGYNRMVSFKHLSKYGRFCNDVIVNFALTPGITVLISVLTRSYIVNIN